MSFIQFKQVVKQFGPRTILHGVNLNLAAGEQYVLQGASGSGKSTLLYLLGGLDKPNSGEIKVGEAKINELNDEGLSYYRNRYVGFVFQFHFLLPTMRCLENILLPAQIGGQNIKEVTKKVEAMARTLEVADCLKKYPYEISGGEQQRINIIRALSLGPKLLLCDEPTGNLDSFNSARVTRLLQTLAREYGATLLVVTHDANVAQQFSNILYLKDGVLMFSM